MCGRYVSVARMAELIERYKATDPGDDTQLEPSYDPAPDPVDVTGCERAKKSLRDHVVNELVDLVRLAVECERPVVKGLRTNPAIPIEISKASGPWLLTRVPHLKATLDRRAAHVGRRSFGD